MSGAMYGPLSHSPVHDIPQALVLGPLLLAGLGVMLWRLRTGHRFSWPRLALGALACGYAVGALRAVLQPFQIGIDRRYYPGWRAFVHLTPLLGAEVSDLALNILLFAPLGLLLPVLVRARSVLRVLLIGLAVSVTVEATQLLLDVVVSVGRVADVNDVIGDVIGTIVGYLIFRAASHLPLLNRLLHAMSWPAPARRRDPSELGGNTPPRRTNEETYSAPS